MIGSSNEWKVKIRRAAAMNTISSANLIAAFLTEVYSSTLDKIILALSNSKNGADTKLAIPSPAVITPATGNP